MMKFSYGTFNVEEEWKDNTLARLPQIKSEDMLSRVMEELFYSFSNGKILVSHYPFNAHLKAYLGEFGWKFNVISSSDISGKAIKNSEVDTYAVNRELFEIFSEDISMFPALETVKKVNKKDYSTVIASDISPYAGNIIMDLIELDAFATTHKYDFILKELEGVSGKGNIHLTSEKQYKSINRYIEKQLSSGKQLCMVAETFYQIEIDFSSQYVIHKDGTIELICVREIINRGNKYIGSRNVQDDFIYFLNRNSYFKKIEDVLLRLYNDGYWGNVCIDSAVLENKEIVPLIEINARKSMGLISYYIETFILPESLVGTFRSMDISTRSDFNFCKLKKDLELLKILVKKKGDKGIFIASANTFDYFFVPQRGRIYFYTIGATKEEEEILIEQFKMVLESNKITIY